jgi:hypothetical protein
MTLDSLRGRVLEIGSSGRHSMYVKSATVDVYEPSKKEKLKIDTDVDATITLVQEIPNHKYDAIVISHVYEILGKKKAQQLSTIIAARVRIEGLVIIYAHPRPSFLMFITKRWTGRTMDDTEHGLKKVDSYTENGDHVTVYKRAVR